MTEIDPRSLPALPALMIAGPGEMHGDDLNVLGHQVLAHYGDIWTQIHSETIALLGRILGAADPPYLIPGTGTTCLDAAVMNLFEPGQKVVTADTGFFGTRLMEVCRANGLEVTHVPVEVGAPIDAERVAEAAKGAHGLLTVQVETATGVRHPVQEIAEVARAQDLIYVVDGVASVGGEAVSVDGMNIDALVTGSQKGLEAPPGLGMLALSGRARDRLESRSSRPRSWYLDLKVWDWYRSEWAGWHPHPVTMPTNLVLALNSSLRRILEVGLETWVQNRHALASCCRDGLQKLGMKAVPQAGCEANLVVAMWAEDPAAIQAHLIEHEGIMISGGLTPTTGKAIRVGLMGRTATDEMVERALGGIRAALAAS